MVDNNDKINQLLEKLELLMKRQDNFSREINNLRSDINQLKTQETVQTDQKGEVVIEIKPVATDFEIKKEPIPVQYQAPQQPINSGQPKQNIQPINKAPKGKSDLEKFIGENLTNKIGIAITVIGVAIGAKYSIDNDLISPLTRIILGYLFGLGLLGIGIKLKMKYENYSAVLVSGAMAILYFITYASYGFYHLIPQMMAFVLMLIFTVFTVIAAINYNRQIIAHIGLVGAYAVPFILSDGSGKVAVLFAYMAIINVGILAIAFKKYWKALYNVSFGLTWLIVLSWYITSYQGNKDFALALVFTSIFFTIFYLTFLAYKVLQKEKFGFNDIVLLLINSFVFYGIGFSILAYNQTGSQLLGLFTLINALVHSLASFVIYKQKLADKNILYLIAGLVLVFITITIPVQLDGNWVTLLWAGEAALLFWIGRTKHVPFYERLSYVLMLLAFTSIVQDWTYFYNAYNTEIPSAKIKPILNVNFLTSFLFIGAFVFINVLNQKKDNSTQIEPPKGIFKIFNFIIPAMLISAIYLAFRIEIATYWNQLFAHSAIKINSSNQDYSAYSWNEDLRWFKSIWIINYTLLFVSILAFANMSRFKNRKLGWINLGLIVFALFIFLTQGLYNLSELRENYLEREILNDYARGPINIWLRYISFTFVALALYSCFKYIKEEFTHKNTKVAFELVFHATVLWIASSELINWIDIFKPEQSYKLGLSVLWGSYSLFLIAFGIWKKNKPLRIGAISLFGITLVKLFFYDIIHLNTLAKTIVFVSLGVLLLIISFLYNKYKHLISDDEVAH